MTRFEDKKEPVTSRLDELLLHSSGKQDAILQRAKEVLTLSENIEKRLKSSETIGFHGTGVATLYYLIREGHLPVRKDTEQPLLKNRIFIAPKEEAGFCPPFITFYNCFFEPPEKTASIYALHAAREQFLLEKSKLPFGAEDNSIELTLIDMETEELSSNDPNHRLGTLAAHRKGFILGVSRNIVGDFKYHTGDAEDDIAIVCPEGLPLSYITAVKPLGYWEASWLDRLKKRIAKQI